MKLSPRMRFLINNGLKGIAWLSILLIVFFFIEKTVIAKDPEMWDEIFYARPILIYLIYIASEFFIGIVPPELFMIWAMNKGSATHYVLNLTFFALVSYVLGYLTFLIGKFLYKRVSFRYIRIRFLKNSWPQLKKYGIFLIIVAALTPIPWSATCILVGSAGYPTERFLRYSLFRLLRFAVYGYIVFQTHQM
jgi:membrane protein DedA with SNARE-associated domain